jgi:hypothetical protein
MTHTMAWTDSKNHKIEIYLGVHSDGVYAELLMPEGTKLCEAVKVAEHYRQSGVSVEVIQKVVPND